MRNLFVVTLMTAAMFAPPHAPLSVQSDARYTVTITNLTKGQKFTPILLATHSPAVRLFAPGTQASPQMQVLAEEGATDMLVTPDTRGHRLV